MSTKKLFSKVLFISFLFLTQFQLLAATHIVNGGMYYFTPSSLTIDQGDTVIWINDMGFHDGFHEFTHGSQHLLIEESIVVH